jgi:hypothetical protein
LQTREAVPALLHASRDADPMLQGWAVQALKKIDPRLTPG